MFHHDSRSRILAEFVKNTMLDQRYAENILIQNGWDLKKAYSFVERRCKDQNSFVPGHMTDDIRLAERQSFFRPAQGLESGHGIPVANRASTLSGSSFTPPLQRASIAKFPVEPLQNNASNTLPRAKERIIPIQYVGINNLSSAPPRAVQQPAQVKAQGFQANKPQTDRVPPQQQNEAKTVQTSSSKGEPKLKRGISNIMENESLLTETRSCVLHDIEEDSHDHMYILTFVLPDLTKHNESFRAFLQKELVETSTLVSLEQAGRLNWWAEMRICQRLWPMATTGDGNCLLHAASLAMWGVHDRQLILRNALFDKLTKSTYRDALYRRWKWQQTITNKESGLVYSEAEWTEEWANLLKLASTKPRNLPDQESNRRNSCCDSAVTQGSDTPVVYESLEEFHVFVLSHVLERPIIVVADKVLKDSSGEALAPIPFGGIYLPLECSRFYRSPLLLTYDAAHFSALVPMEQDIPNTPPAAIPLVDPDLILLPIHFYTDPGAKYDWVKPSNKVIQDPTLEDKLNLLQKFLDVEKIQVPNMYNDNEGESDKNSVGSYDSDDNVGCVGKAEKEKKKEYKQMQSIGKQFGSIGKTVGKKLKKNFGNLTKGPKGNHNNGRKESVGSVITQSTKVITSLATSTDKDKVWCARLSTRRTENQQSMVKNYMSNARERYEKDRELKRQKGEELRSKIAEASQSGNQNNCVSPGCNLYGTPELSYMCSQCFNRQKVMEDQRNQKIMYNTFPGYGRAREDPNGPQRYPEGEEILKHEYVYRY